jgi:hypothetical protein
LNLEAQGISTRLSMNSAWRFTMDHNAREDLAAHTRVGPQVFSDLQGLSQILLLRGLFHALTRGLGCKGKIKMRKGYADFVQAFVDKGRTCFWPAAQTETAEQSMPAEEVRQLQQAQEPGNSSKHRDVSASPPFPTNGIANLRQCDYQAAFDMMSAAANYSHWGAVSDWLLKNGNHHQLTNRELSCMKAFISQQKTSSQEVGPAHGDALDMPAAADAPAGAQSNQAAVAVHSTAAAAAAVVAPSTAAAGANAKRKKPLRAGAYISSFLCTACQVCLIRLAHTLRTTSGCQENAFHFMLICIQLHVDHSQQAYMVVHGHWMLSKPNLSLYMLPNE